MKVIINKALGIISVLVTFLAALLVCGLGYFLTSLALNFGWRALAALLCIFVIFSVLEGVALAIVTAPFTVGSALYRRVRSIDVKPEEKESPEDKARSKLLSKIIVLLLVLGALIAGLQFIIQGPI